MSWYSRNLKLTIAAAALFACFLTGVKAEAAVFIYEVVTRDTSFQTASKLPPDAFLMYNGGEDIIRSLKIIAKYADKDFEKALRDYGLYEKNLRYLPHVNPDNNTIQRRPFYWWR